VYERIEKEINMAKKNIGSSFDDFLKEEAMLEEVTAVAMKRVIAWQIAQEMKVQQLTKTALAKRMHTSRAALNRLLDENDSSLTLTTLASAAAALGKKVNLQLAPA
jgi:antitoxin HicB